MSLENLQWQLKRHIMMFFYLLIEKEPKNLTSIFFLYNKATFYVKDSGHKIRPTEIIEEKF